jgi:sigma-B regulation protein RsbU (phosphoserine phosphatase)
MPFPVDAVRAGRRRLECAEVWAGSDSTASLLELPGLVAWVYSSPAESGEAGGDIHFVSLCPSCIVGRVALADVSGHGPAVQAIADRVRELMQQYLAALEQGELMRDLNRALQELDGVHYATMVALGWHSRAGLLMLSNAGHPPPFVFRAARGEWNCLNAPATREPGRRPVGVPLGLLANVDYGRTVVKPRDGDLVLLYSDGVSEARNPAGDELGRDGLMSMVRSLDPSSADAFGLRLTDALREFRGDARRRTTTRSSSWPGDLRVQAKSIADVMRIGRSSGSPPCGRAATPS